METEQKDKLNLENIRDLIKTEKIVFGKDEVLKNLRNSNLAKILLSSNVPEETITEIRNFSGLNNTEVLTLDIPNVELGAICKKPFSVSMIGVLANKK